MKEFKLKDWIKKICMVIILTPICAGLFSLPGSEYFTEEDLSSYGYILCSQTDELELFLDEENGFFAVRDISSGYVWYSVPLDWEEDTVSSGFNKNAVPSIITIRTKDDKGSFYPANSYTNVVRRNTLDVQEIENGFRLVQFFKREGIEVPVDITIEERTLLVSVPLGEIWENDEDVLRILDFTLTPYFGSAGPEEKGYMFVPDGSGALINFTNRNSDAVYQQYVYGRDNSIIPVMKKTVTEDVLLPVFGMKRRGAGFIAVFEQSASRGFISAETSFQKTNYNAINASCVVRDYDVFSFRERTGTPRDIKIFEKGNFADEVFSVRYILLDEEESDYTGMAKAYRSYLQANGSFPVEKNAADTALVLNFLGNSEKKQPVAGIPMNVMMSYTPFSDVVKTIEKLELKGVEKFVVKYDGWTDGGLFGSYPVKAAPEKAAGGKKDFSSMLETLGKKNIPFFGGADFVNLYKSNITHLKELHANRSINKTPAAIPEYALSTFNVKADSDPFWILKAPSIEKFSSRFYTSLEKYPSLGLAPDSLAGTLASDFSNKDGTSRSQTAAVFESIIAKFSSSRKLFFSRPFAYALPYTTFAADLPCTSSRFDIEDASVPFYQIVLKGYIPFSNLPANRSLDQRSYVLSLLESGAMPSFVWVTQNADKMRDTRLDSYMSVFADDWFDESTAIYKEVSPILDLVKGSEIISHKILDNGLREIMYEGGITIITNPTSETVSHSSGLVLKSMSYTVRNAVKGLIK